MNYNFSELKDRKAFYNSMPWRHKREAIKQRDNYECQWCKEEGKLKHDNGQRDHEGKKQTILVVHHIQEVEHRPDLRMDDDNLITICFECHEAHHGRAYSKQIKWNDERW
ncbi:HNH endonuclease [Salinicoccus roseus]|uniref:HNH endonuclease n=1 Tax=Salinicoccus roseus TaxID=45670 RepID=UPI0023012390|nr:HNH endonuclease [Salinicoccus roseus]